MNSTVRIVSELECDLGFYEGFRDCVKTENQLKTENQVKTEVVQFLKRRFGQCHDSPPSHSELAYRSLVLLVSAGGKLE